MQNPTNIFESIDEMVALCQRKVVLLGQMKRALRIAELLGVHPRDIRGKVSMSTYDTGRNYFFPWKATVLRVRVDDDPVREFKLGDVHLELWPTDIRLQFERNERKKLCGTHNG